MNKWTLINQATRPTRSGTPLTNEALALIVWAVQTQVNEDYVPLCGGEPCSIRTSDGKDLEPGEKVLTFVDELPSSTGTHLSTHYCAVPTCDDLFGPSGASVDVSQEVLGDAGNPGCAYSIDDGRGHELAVERCAPVELQTYEKLHSCLSAVRVSNFLLDAWFDVASRGPFTFTSKKGIVGYKEPPGPFRAAPGGFLLTFPSGSSKVEKVFGKDKLEDLLVENHMSVLRGFPRKRNGALHWSSRPSKIIAARNSRTQKLIDASKAA